MIATLRHKHHTKVTGRWSRRKNGRWWTDEEIRVMFGMTKHRFKKAVEAYQAASPREWSRARMARAVLQFALKHKRWPRSIELDRHNFRLELPPRSSMANYFGSPVNMWSDSWEPPLAGLIRYIVRDRTLQRRLTPELILAIRNVTVRREAMEFYGVERLLRRGGGTCVHKDKYGKLWRLPSDNERDDHAQWVEVVNATADPDGSFQHFFLRVPPEIETAQAAVAWTFREEESEFAIKAAT